MLNSAIAVLLVLLPWPCLGQEAAWPDLSQPVQAVGGGEHDAAVVVGIERYSDVPGVPGAKSNAKAWYEYLTETRGVPAQNVRLLINDEATREQMLKAAGQKARQAGPEGTLWFVFVGHGAPAADGKDGLLVGRDALQTAESLQERSVRRGELLKALAASQAGSIRVVIDACFSGRGPDGATIVPGLQPLVAVTAAGPADPRMVVLTAAKGNQFAGALPGANRPAFSYLVLGGLRGWAAQGKSAVVTAGDLWRYAKNALEATLRGRDQTPDLIGKENAVVAPSAGEKGPNLSKLAEATAGEMFKISSLPSVPEAAAPEAMGEMGGAADWRNLDVDALQKYDEATKFDKGEASAEDKAAKWRDLAQAAPKFAEKAEARAAQWDRYAKQLAAQEEARQKRAEARDKDWEKLGKLLALEVVPKGNKKRWAVMFVQAYGKTSKDNPYVAELAPYLPPGTVRVVPGAKPAAARHGKARIEWVTIPGGSFTMGSGNGDEGPQHQVTVQTFQMAKTLVTMEQYKACVDAGACTAPDTGGYCNWGVSGREQHPINCVDWSQAKAFSEWVGGRLPSEAEWEYAARSAGKDWKYPWGDEAATCETAAIIFCSSGGTAPVCSKPAGNTKQGLCDMAGNAWEWVQDWYHNSYNGAPTDGSAWENPAGSYRVGRGGSWNLGAVLARAAARYSIVPGIRYGDIGFRPARRGPVEHLTL